MSYECFAVEIQDNIAHVILNRPDKRNAMNRAFWREFPAIIQDIDDNAKARVIVISSTGPHFSAGLDLSMFGGGNDTGEQITHNQRAVSSYNHILHMQKSFNCLEECRLPVLAAPAAGLGSAAPVKHSSRSTGVRSATASPTLRPSWKRSGPIEPAIANSASCWAYRSWPSSATPTPVKAPCSTA